MAVNEGRKEDETRIHVLLNIEKFNKDGTDPTFNYLVENLSVAKPQLERCVSELMGKRYIMTTETSWRNMYTKTHYKITQEGKSALEQYRHQVQRFVDTLKQLYEDNKKEELHQLVMKNKDFLWFAYYDGLIIKREIENIAKKLDVGIPQIWWDESMQGFGSRYGDGFRLP